MRLFILFTILLHTIGVWSQSRPDKNWVGGFEEYPSVPGHSNYIIHFQSDTFQIDTLNLGVQIESTVAFWSDAAGELLFFSNGCGIYDASGNVLTNGDDINPGAIHDLMCPTIGYTVPKGAMVLPYPDKPNSYYLLHLGAKYDFNHLLHFGPLYYSVVGFDNGVGSVSDKNTVIMDSLPESFAVVRHGNGRDWWLVAPKLNSDQLYLFLIDPTGIHASDIVSTGTVFAGKRPGSSVFSPNGALFARYHCEKGIVVAGFDRCNGTFSNTTFLSPPAPLPRGGGISFSNKSNALFVNSQTTCYHIDLNQSLPKWDTLIYVNDYASWGTTLGEMQYAPDGKLYISQISRSSYMNAVVQDAAGQGQFVFQGLKLPVKQVRSMPNLPNFGLYDLPNSVCDTLGIDDPTSTKELYGNDIELVVYPSPAKDKINVSVGNESIHNWKIFDLTGRLVLDGKGNSNLLTISLEHCSAGTYMLSVVLTDGKSTSKVFWVE